MSARPGKTKMVVRIDLARPRDYEMRLSARFNQIKAEIWTALKEELIGRRDGNGV